MAFAAYLSMKLRVRPGTVGGYISAIRTWRAQQGAPAVLESGRVRLVLQGIRTNPIAAPKRPAPPPRFPVTVGVLMQLRSVLDLSQYDHALLWCAALFGVLGLLRSGEFTLSDDHRHRPAERERRTLRRRHMQLTRAADGRHTIELRVPIAKTMPEGFTVFYSENTQSSSLCPIAAWRAYEAARSRRFPQSSNTDREAPLFLSPTGTGPLAQRQLVSMLRNALRAAGFSPSDLTRFSGHSFRRGGAQSLRDAGWPIEQVMAAGRWRSRAVHAYFISTPELARAYAPYFARSAKFAPFTTPAFDPETAESVLPPSVTARTTAAPMAPHTLAANIASTVAGSSAALPVARVQPPAASASSAQSSGTMAQATSSHSQPPGLPSRPAAATAPQSSNSASSASSASTSSSSSQSLSTPTVRPAAGRPSSLSFLPLR